MIIAREDALIAAQNAVVAAQSPGIGSCYIGDILEKNEDVVSVLNLDKYVFPVALLVFGYPTKHQENIEKPLRFNKKYIVRKNKYSRLSEVEGRQMFKAVYSVIVSIMWKV